MEGDRLFNVFWPAEPQELMEIYAKDEAEAKRIAIQRFHAMGVYKVSARELKAYVTAPKAKSTKYWY